MTTMPSGRLQQEIQRLRRRKGVSLKQLSDCMGWTGTAPLVAIESGRRMPKAETISRMMECIGGAFSDECLLMGLAGYLPSIPIPSPSQIKSELEPVCEHIRSARYPIYISDFRFTYWVGNPATARFFSTVDSSDALRQILEYRLTTFDLIFDSRSLLHSLLVNSPAILREQVRLFKTQNVFRQHEAFYLEYPDIMKQRLLSHDYAEFRYIWETTTADNTLNPMNALSYFTVAVGGEVIEFQLMVSYSSWLGGLFNLISGVPRDTPDNLRRFNTLFPPETEAQESCIKLWDIIPEERLEAVLQAYRTGLPI